VCPGTYAGGVVVDKTLSIVGIGQPVIDATGQDNGIQILASASTVRGFTVENATGEGILVGYGPTPVADVTVADNTLTNNDLGNPTGAPLTTSPYPQCNAANNVPGDCGEAIHLSNAIDSTIVGNNVHGNSGGILLSDDTGQVHGNLIEFNVVSGNTEDCGITIAGHVPAFAGGGVYDNTVRGNWVTNNGVAGQGGGVLLASGVPGYPLLGPPGGIGGAVYDNLIEGNYLAGNGLAGVTLHAHSPGENLNGNQIIGNVIGTNNLAPDMDFGPQFFDPDTTGVIVVSASNVSITVEHNVITHNVNGIWLGQDGSTITLSGGTSNLFLGVTNPLTTVS
jgi:parallel beta-helix repeat protein